MLSRAVPVLAVLGVAVAVLVRSHPIPEAHAAPNTSAPSATTFHALYTLAWTAEKVPTALVSTAGARPRRVTDRKIFTLAWQDAPHAPSRKNSRTATAAAPTRPPRFVLAGMTTP